MMPSANQLERRLQVSGVLLILGLMIEAACLFWTRPIGFVLFLGVGGLLLSLGIIVYLYALISARPTQP